MTNSTFKCIEEGSLGHSLKWDINRIYFFPTSSSSFVRNWSILGFVYYYLFRLLSFIVFAIWPNSNVIEKSDIIDINGVDTDRPTDWGLFGNRKKPGTELRAAGCWLATADQRKRKKSDVFTERGLFVDVSFSKTMEETRGTRFSGSCGGASLKDLDRSTNTVDIG